MSHSHSTPSQTKSKVHLLTLLERKTRKGFTIKIAGYHSQTVLETLESVIQEQSEHFKSIYL